MTINTLDDTETGTWRHAAVRRTSHTDERSGVWKQLATGQQRLYEAFSLVLYAECRWLDLVMPDEDINSCLASYRRREETWGCSVIDFQSNILWRGFSNYYTKTDKDTNSACRRFAWDLPVHEQHDANSTTKTKWWQSLLLHACFRWPPTQSTNSPRMCEKLQAVWTLRSPGERMTTAGRGRAAAATRWGMLGPIVRSQSEEEISREMWPQYYPSVHHGVYFLSTCRLWWRWEKHLCCC